MAPPSEIALAPNPYRVEFFAYSPDVMERIERWAQQRGVRVLTKVPIYFDYSHEERQRTG